MSYKHKWVNDWARYCLATKCGGVTIEYTTRVNAEYNAAGTELRIHQRYTDAQMELEAQGWTPYNAGDEGIDFDLAYDYEWVGEVGASDIAAYRLSNADGYKDGVKLSVNDKPEWIGGVPPLGVVCEVWHGDEWIKCLVLGGDIYNNIAYQLATGEYKGEFNATPTEADFRPIQTDKERVIYNAANVLGDICPLPEVLNKLYDAGCLIDQDKGEKQ